MDVNHGASCQWGFIIGRMSDKPRKLVSPVGRPGERGTALPPVRIAGILRTGAKPVARPAAFL